MKLALRKRRTIRLVTPRIPFRHRVAHWLGWNRGEVEVWTEPDGVLWVGWRCVCGELRAKKPMPSFLQRQARR